MTTTTPFLLESFFLYSPSKKEKVNKNFLKEEGLLGSSLLAARLYRI